MLRALACTLALLGCSEISDLTEPCKSNSDCTNGRICDPTGECIVECYLDTECDAGVCAFNRCRPPEDDDGPADAGPDAAD